jgi:hypothetical protein
MKKKGHQTNLIAESRRNVQNLHLPSSIPAIASSYVNLHRDPSALIPPR